MTIEHANLMSSRGVQLLASDWFGIEVPQSIAEVISLQFTKISEQSTAIQCLHLRAISVGAIAWLKSRLIEKGLFVSQALGCPEIRLICLLHMPSLQVPDDEVADWQEPPNYARSRITRSPLSRIEPIDAVAARMVKVRDHTSCPECGKYFRNAAAHRLHLVEGLCQQARIFESRTTEGR